MKIKLVYILLIAILIGLITLSSMLFVKNQRAILSFVKNIDKVGLLQKFYQPAALYGEPCNSSSECTLGLYCENGTWICNYCSASSNCQNDNFYGLNYYCQNPAGGQGTCTNYCSDTPACYDQFGGGYWCGQDHTCHTACAINTDCETNQVCSGGTCYTGNCSSPSDCSGGLCTSFICSPCTNDTECTVNMAYGAGYWCSYENGNASARKCKNSCAVANDCPGQGYNCGRDGQCYSNCTTNTQCPADNICTGNSCSSGSSGGRCAQSSDCYAVGEVCSDGSCSVPPVGCTSSSECSGLICSNYSCISCGGNSDCTNDSYYGSGYWCTQGGTCSNSSSCSSSSDCQSGSWCGQNGTCYNSCTQDSECPSGSVCDNGSCYSGNCGSVSQCTFGQVCINYNCSACTQSYECITQVGPEYWCGQNGTCYNSCSSNSECPSGNVCDRGSCLVGNCTDDSTCNGYSCVNYTCGTSCASDSDCAIDNVCARSGYCVMPKVWTPLNCGSDGNWWNDINNWTGSYSGVDNNAVVRVNNGPACSPQIQAGTASAQEVVVNGGMQITVNSGMTLNVGHTLSINMSTLSNDGTINVPYLIFDSATVYNTGIINISGTFTKGGGGATVYNTGTINCPTSLMWSDSFDNCISASCSTETTCDSNFGSDYYCTNGGICSNDSFCTVDANCPLGSWCGQDTACHTSCTSETECASGDLCVSGSCLNPNCTPGSSGDSYCYNTFSGGWCGSDSRCHTSCTTGSDCRPDYECIYNGADYSCVSPNCTPGSDGNAYCYGSYGSSYWCAQSGGCFNGSNSCSTTSDCRLGDVCDSGTCYTGDCVNSIDYCSGQICDSHSCRVCSDSVDCGNIYGEGYFCSQAGSCRNTTFCSIDSECANNFWCGQDGSCHDSCVINNDCHAGWECNGGTCQQIATSTCGNSIIEEGETCDDGNAIAGDGCSNICAVENHYVCSGAPSTCYRCGDGIRQGSEECDDGNILNADGCSTTCTIEANHVCSSGNPSVCHIVGGGTGASGSTGSSTTATSTTPRTPQQTTTIYTQEQLQNFSTNVITKIQNLINQDLTLTGPQQPSITPVNRIRMIQILQRMLESLKQLLKFISFEGVLNFV